MSSRAQRQATSVWLLADALVGASSELVAVGVATERLKPHVLMTYDKTMRRIQNNLHNFVIEALETDKDDCISEEHMMAYMHMLTALVGDQWLQCPDQPPDRKRNWRRLNNVIADYIESSDPTGEIGVELGCRWAEQIKEILRG